MLINKVPHSILSTDNFSWCFVSCSWSSIAHWPQIYIWIWGKSIDQRSNNMCTRVCFRMLTFGNWRTNVRNKNVNHVVASKKNIYIYIYETLIWLGEDEQSRFQIGNKHIAYCFYRILFYSLKYWRHHPHKQYTWTSLISQLSPGL